MVSFIKACSYLALAATALAGPVAIRNTDLAVLDERGIIPSLHLGNFSLVTSHIDEVLLDVGYGTTSARVGDAFQLTVKCIDCRTWGSATISTTGVYKKVDLVKDIISFFKDPLDAVVEAFDVNVKIALDNVGGHFKFNVMAMNQGSYSFPIFTSQTPAGFAISDDVSLGLVLAIDLVFSMTEVIDLDAGFEFAFPAGAQITVDPINGHIVDQAFPGAEIDNLPIVIHAGLATFKAALRVRVQAGTTVELFGTGFDFELGVTADLVEYIATIGTSDQCKLFINESVDVNVGAFAHAVVEFDYQEFGASPAVVTTLLELPLPSLCLNFPAQTFTPSVPTVAPIAIGSAVTTKGVTDSTLLTMLSAIAPDTTSSPGGVFRKNSTSIQQSTTATIPQASITQSPVPSAGIYIYKNSTLSANTATISANTAITSANATITSAATLTTSTVYATDLITITACSDAVLHCPASQASKLIITSVKILYTTICPIGATLPSTIPAATQSSLEILLLTAAIPTHISNPLPLKTLATPVVNTIYTPTFVNPTYVMPTATVFPVANPGWNSTSGGVFHALDVAKPSTANNPVPSAGSDSVLNVGSPVPSGSSSSVSNAGNPVPSAGSKLVLNEGNITVPVASTSEVPAPLQFNSLASNNKGMRFSMMMTVCLMALSLCIVVL